MSSPTPQQSPLERAKAKMDKQNQEKGTTLFNICTDFLTQIERFTASQDRAINNANDASESLQQRIQALESSLEAEKKSSSSQSQSYQATLTKLQHANRELRESQNLREALQKELDAAKQQNVGLPAELELAKNQSADLQKRFDTVEQRNVDLQADLKAARQQASTAEDRLKALKTRFSQQFNDFMTRSDGPSEQTQPQPASSPARSSVPQNSVVDRHNGPQIRDHPFPTLGLDAHTSTTTSDKGPDILHCQNVLDEVMDKKHWDHNRYFLKAWDPHNPASLDAKLGPMNLGSMQEKLARKAYSSSTSFEADFKTMIADCKQLNPPQNPVHIAAEQLSKIFEQAFSAQPISSHQSLSSVFPIQTPRNKRKRVASTLCDSDSPSTQESKSQSSSETTTTHDPKRRSSALLKHNTNRVQPVNPRIRRSLQVASSPYNKAPDNSHGPEQTLGFSVDAKIVTNKRFGINVSLTTVGKLVSVTKSPTTMTRHWESFVPDEYYLTKHDDPDRVGAKISTTAFTLRDFSKDIIILRLLPTGRICRPSLDIVVGYFLEKNRFATVRHAGIDDVEDMYLVPVSKTADYPAFLPMLDLDLVPRNKKDDMLFVVIVFRVTADKQEQIRDAWDVRMKAIQDHENDSLDSMRKTLVRNHLPMFYRTGIVSSQECYMAILDDVPYYEEIARPEPRACGQGVLRLSFPMLDTGSQPRVGANMAPKWVFVLGRVISSCKPQDHCFLVVDIQESDRSLWEIRRVVRANRPPSWTIKLLASKFPGSWKEWEEISGGSSDPDCGKDLCVELERCKPID